jgi:hypothetical protein
MDIREISLGSLEEEVKSQNVLLPIEQSAIWAKYQATISGRTPWGALAASVDGSDVAVCSFLDFQTHGYHYLNAVHGPIWFHEPTEDEEEELAEALADYLHKHDRRQVFIRMALVHDIAESHPALSTVPYDHTVIIDVTGGDDAILSRMKPRGRRDVRKALRESPAVCADETEAATQVLPGLLRCDGRDRQARWLCAGTDLRLRGHDPSPRARALPRLCGQGRRQGRYLVHRHDSGKRAVRYYGASLNEYMRQHVTDKLVYFECCDLAKNKGIESYDMMGIGSDFAPSLLGLNEFKCKFTKETAEVAPSRDIPVRRGFYALLVKARDVVVARPQACRGRGGAQAQGRAREGSRRKGEA